MMKIDKWLRIISIVLLAFLASFCTICGTAYLIQGDTKLGIVMLLITLQVVVVIVATLFNLRKH